MPSNGDSDRLCLFDVSQDPPNPHSCHLPSCKPRRAHRVPVNSPHAIPFSNDNFEGSILVLYKFDGENHRYKDYFENKTRCWEIRIQGRFLRRLEGKLWCGSVLHDMDYRYPMSWLGRMLASLMVPIMQVVTGQSAYHTQGDRGEDTALPAEPELCHFVGKLSSIDQIIVTPAGSTPPSLDGDLTGQGFSRNQMPISEYMKEVQAIEAGINTEDTYTFCIWCVARYYSMADGAITNLVPWTSVDINGLLDGLPPHAALYELTTDPAGGDESPEQHLEKDKRYIFDLMVLSTVAEKYIKNGSACPEQRYVFSRSTEGRNTLPKAKNSFLDCSCQNMLGIIATAACLLCHPTAGIVRTAP